MTPFVHLGRSAAVGSAAVALLVTFACAAVLGSYVLGPLTTERHFGLLAFGVSGLAIAWLGGWMRAQRRRAQRATAESGRDLARLSEIVGAVGIGICAVDAARKIVFVNPAAERILGRPASELMGRPLPSFEKVCSWPLPNGGAVLALEEYVDRALDRAEKLLGEASRQLAQSIDYDATIRRIARLAARNIGDWCAVVVLDATRRPSVVAVECADRGEAAFRPGDVTVDLMAERGLGRVLRTGEAELLREVQASEGLAPPELLSGVALKSFMAVPMRARGELLGAIAFIDSTQRFDDQDLSLAEELAGRCALALDQAGLYRSAHDAKRAREEILAVVSHDLRNPLNVIRTAARTLERGPHDDATIREVGGLVARSSARMTRLIEDLLDFARIESGRLSVARSPQDAAFIAREVVEAAWPDGEERHVAVVAEAPPEPVTVDCDRDRIVQALANLLSNALNVSREGGTITVSVEAREGLAVFRVRDEGPGIPERDLPHLFDRYWRGGSTPYEGTGLGLSIVKAVVELHGGRLWVESSEGGGSTFSFSLPASVRENRIDIFVVDDDPDIRHSIAWALEHEGYHVATAADGREAWDRLHASSPPSLILLDVMMPNMNGAELLELLQADAQLSPIPVVVISAFGSIAAPIAAASHGYLPKPIDLDHLLTMTARYCHPRPPEVVQ